MTVTYQTETLDTALEDMKPLLRRHWSEIARNQDVIALDPDYDAYHRLEAAGFLRVFTARKGSEMVGYALYFVKPHIHYRRDVWAVCDIVFIAPEHRGRAGIGLLRFCESRLRALGVSVMHTTGKVEHPALAAVLGHLGHTRIEFGYAKLLKEV